MSWAKISRKLNIHKRTVQKVVLPPTRSHLSRIVWGGGIKSDLVFIPGKATLNSAAYVTTVMEPHLVPLWHRRCEEYGWVVVVEDGAPGHRGHTKKYRELNGMDALPWPAQSPDLNFIEALWQDVEVELGQVWGRVSDLETLEAAVKAVGCG